MAINHPILNPDNYLAFNYTRSKEHSQLFKYLSLDFRNHIASLFNNQCDQTRENDKELSQLVKQFATFYTTYYALKELKKLDKSIINKHNSLKLPSLNRQYERQTYDDLTIAAHVRYNKLLPFLEEVRQINRSLALITPKIKHFYLITDFITSFYCAERARIFMDCPNHNYSKDTRILCKVINFITELQYLDKNFHTTWMYDVKHNLHSTAKLLYIVELCGKQITLNLSLVSYEIFDRRTDDSSYPISECFYFDFNDKLYSYEQLDQLLHDVKTSI